MDGIERLQPFDRAIVASRSGARDATLTRVRVAGPFARRVDGLAGEDDVPAAVATTSDWWPTVWPGVATIRMPSNGSWSPATGRSRRRGKSIQSRIVWSVVWAISHSAGWT